MKKGSHKQECRKLGNVKKSINGICYFTFSLKEEQLRRTPHATGPTGFRAQPVHHMTAPSVRALKALAV